MEPNDGQRRVDSRDGWAPFVVRPAYRADPSPQPSITNAVVSLCALTVIALVFALCILVRP